jgi:hypothetical protein
MTATVGVVPSRSSDPGEVRALAAQFGAAVLVGVDPSEAGAEAGARAVLGDDALDVRAQFRATQRRSEELQAYLAALPEDAPAKRRNTYDRTTPLPPHNDGFAFGDEMPDQLFLCCVRPCATGGASWLVDGLALIDALRSDPSTAWVADQAWSTSIEHSDPAYGTVVGPVARRLPTGRCLVRQNPYQWAGPGAPPQVVAFATAWSQACARAAAAVPRFRLARGELLCVDNYRVAHGRDPYEDPEREVVSTWAWTATAITVPGALHLL